MSIIILINKMWHRADLLNVKPEIGYHKSLHGVEFDIILLSKIENKTAKVSRKRLTRRHRSRHRVKVVEKALF